MLTPAQTTHFRRQVRATFADFRRGHPTNVALMKAACCQTCSWALIDEQYFHADLVVFLNAQDQERFKSGHLFVAHGGKSDPLAAGRRLARCAEQNGLDVRWNDTAGRRVELVYRVEG